GRREYSLTASSNEPRLCCVRYNSTFVHATLPLPLHRVRTVARADGPPRHSLARRLPATHIPLARRPTRAPAHAPADRRTRRHRPSPCLSLRPVPTAAD